MNSALPFGFPGPTALYLSLYVVTLALHVLFMNYALAGSLYVGAGALTGKRSDSAIRARIIEALPFAVGLAITAGVAPLLFVQILYEKRFYTANLLLQHRWMLIVPALTLGFYLLYLLKSDAAKKRRWLAQVSALGAAGCFAFVAWSWTENHLLSRDQHAWVATYAADKLIYSSVETGPRLLTWVLGAFATMALLVGFQLRTAEQRGETVATDDVRRLARIGVGGLLLGGAAALGYYATTATLAARTAATGPLARPYLVITAVGAALQLASWLLMHRRGALVPAALNVAALGLGLALIGSGAVREAMRLGAIDIGALYPNHARAAQAQGLWLFVAFLMLNGVLIAFAFRLARRAALHPDAEPPLE